MREFCLLGNTVTFSTEEYIAINVYRKYMKYATDEMSEFLNFYRMQEYLDMDIIEVLNEYVSGRVIVYLQKVFNLVTTGEEENDDVDFQYMKDTYLELLDSSWIKAIDSLEEKYCDLLNSKEELQYYRELRKENRRRWVGGGFGIAGAIKGAAQAQLLNAVTGGVHSIVNSLGNLKDQYKIKREIIDLFKQEQDELCKAFGMAIASVQFLHIYVIGKQKQKLIEPLVMGPEYEYIFQKIEKLNHEQLLENRTLLIQCIKQYPLDCELYRIILENWGDEKHELDKIMSFLGLESELFRLKTAMLSKLEEKINFEDEESLKANLEIIKAEEKRIGLQNSDLRRTVEGKLKEIDLSARKVYTIKIANEDPLTLKDGEEIVYSDKLKAQEAKKTKEEMIEVFNLISKNLDDENNLCRIHVQLMELNKKFQVGTELVEYAEKIVKQSLENKFVVKGIRYESLEEAEDIRKRTVGDVTFATEKEALLYAEEEKKLNRILESESIDFASKIQVYLDMVHIHWSDKRIRGKISDYGKQLKQEYYNIKNCEKEKNIFAKLIIKFSLWLGGSGIALILGLRWFFRTNILGKILILVILYNILVKVKDIVEDFIENNEFNSDVKKSRKQATELIQEEGTRLRIKNTNIYIGELEDFDTLEYICSKCKKSLDKTWRVCPYCGNKNI